MNILCQPPRLSGESICARGRRRQTRPGWVYHANVADGLGSLRQAKQQPGSFDSRTNVFEDPGSALLCD